MKKWFKRNLVAISIVFVILIAVVVPVAINESYKANKGYVTVWGGSDVLGYFGEIVGAIGTIVLGIVAWLQNIQMHKQNERLVKIEESNFLAQNAGSAVVNAIMVKGINQLATSLDNHAEQIVFSDAYKGLSSIFDSGSISFVCRLEPLDKAQHIALVRVKRALVVIKGMDKTREKVLDMINESPEYSRVSISKDYDEFSITLMLSSKEKNEFVSIAKEGTILIVDLYLTLLTDKYVATELQCSANLESTTWDKEQGISNVFSTKGDSLPRCFWKGAYVADRSNIKVKRSDDRV